MSTTPTEVLETVASANPAEAGFDLEALKGLMDNFDPASLLPDLSTIFGWVVLICRIAVLVGPIVLAEWYGYRHCKKKADVIREQREKEEQARLKAERKALMAEKRAKNQGNKKNKKK